jgi:hypothetical protein
MKCSPVVALGDLFKGNVIFSPIANLQLFLYGDILHDRKEKKIFLVYKKIQKGAVALALHVHMQSYITNDLLIYD